MHLALNNILFGICEIMANSYKCRLNWKHAHHVQCTCTLDIIYNVNKEKCSLYTCTQHSYATSYTQLHMEFNPTKRDL